MRSTLLAMVRSRGTEALRVHPLVADAVARLGQAVAVRAALDDVAAIAASTGRRGVEFDIERKTWHCMSGTSQNHGSSEAQICTSRGEGKRVSAPRCVKGASAVVQHDEAR